MTDCDRSEIKKPTGVTGVTHASFGMNPATATFQAFRFPSSKEEIEALVTEGFLTVAKRGSLLDFVVDRHVQNPTDDYDFTLDTSTGRRYLELLEIAPESRMEGGFQNARGEYRPFDFVRSIIQGISSKSARYDTVSAARAILLLYESHWAFAPDTVTLALLQHATLQMHPKFEEVYWYHPTSPGDGIVEFVYPTPVEYWLGFDPEHYREVVVSNLDPRRWKTGTAGRSLQSTPGE